MHCYSVGTAAQMLGVTPATLRSWRRRGGGPAYVKRSGGYIRSRGVLEIKHSMGAFRIANGKRHWCETKPGGTIFYPADKLRAFVAAHTVPRGDPFLPRPFPGRRPGGRNQKGVAATEAPWPIQSPASSEAVPAAALYTETVELYCPLATALVLDVLPKCLADWRRRGIGMAYVQLPGGQNHRGHIRYPVEELAAFAAAWLVLRGGRLRSPPYPKQPLCPPISAAPHICDPCCQAGPKHQGHL